MHTLPHPLAVIDPVAQPIANSESQVKLRAGDDKGKTSNGFAANHSMGCNGFGAQPTQLGVFVTGLGQVSGRVARPITRRVSSEARPITGQW